MTVLVTGATSMLGGAVARRLTDRGETVRVFQRRPSGLAGVTETLGDIADRDAVREAVRNVEAVVHLAAKVTMTGPWEPFAATNIRGVQHVVDAARDAGVRRLVHVSSPSVAHHGTSLVGVDAGRADPLRARGSYSRSKAAGELIALGADGPELAVVAVRPHLVWGPGDTQLFGRIVERARSGRLAIVGSGAALVDTTYVDNAVDALVAALDRIDAVRGEALVVTNGQPRPVGELVHLICLAAGLPGPRLRVPYRVAWAVGHVLERVWSATDLPDEPPITGFLAEQLATAHWFDQHRTRRLLDWKPAVDVDDGFRRMAAWYAALANC